MNQKNQKIKVGLVGTGHMGQYHLNVATSLPEYDFLGIYDLDQNKSNEVSERMKVHSFSSYEELLNKVDAVIIAVPTAMHYEMGLLALNARKHVLIEKPITVSVKQAQELVDLAEKKDLIMLVGHVERFNGAVLELSKIVQNPFLIEANRVAPYNGRIQDVGVVLDLMIHDLDIVLNLVKEEVVSVHAQGNPWISKTEDIAVATIKFASGCVANFLASRVTQARVRSLKITQENTYIVLNFATQEIDIHRRASSAYLMTREELRYKQEAFVERIEVHRDNPLKQEHNHFIDCIRKKTTPLVKGKEELRTLQIANQILECIDKYTIKT